MVMVPMALLVGAKAEVWGASRYGAVACWSIAGLATAAAIVRPFRIPEAVWAVAGAFALVALGLLPWSRAWAGVTKISIFSPA
jgi:arsenical pump membrane protein